ncbi:MAG TPA: flagellar hook capping FlgD N-terminal domain-containing protein [Rhabdaerophilum sp.]|nr:flagellar hook capping FlgD N-terminal domain-containing protein [Rhabdaerophilum sp.]
MTTIASSALAAASPGASGATNSSAARIADNFDQFLQLLTTQLKNQSPLDPLDTNQFTQQLVQFASVEQQIKTNDSLASLLVANKTANVTNAMGFVGARVTADGTTSALKDGAASWQLNAPRAGQATITIKDKNGNEVYSTTKTLTSGDQTFSWNGTKSNGEKAADGQYTMVVAAKDANGQVMTVKSEIFGTVDGVDVTGDVPVLDVGGILIPVTSVKSVRR